MTPHSLLAGLLLSLALISSIPPPPAAGDTIDDTIRQGMTEGRIPGVALAVVKNGEVVKAAGYGYADLKGEQRMSPDSIFVLDSVTKQFTGVTVMQQVQAGRIALDESVRAYIGEAPPSWQSITIRNLLTHTAGFPHDIAPERLMTLADYRQDVWLRRAFDTSLLFAPGTQFQYSNAGYQILNIVVQRASGQRPAEPYDRGIFGLVAMTSSGIYDARSRPRGMVTGYFFRDDRNRIARRQIIPIGSGAAYSTVLDLAKYDRALHGDGVVSEASKKQMWSPMTLADGRKHPYGFGWSIRQPPSGTVVHHNGGGHGFSTAIYRYLDARITVIVLTNHTPQEGMENADRLVHAVSPVIDPSLVWPAPRRGAVEDDLFFGRPGLGRPWRP